MDNLILWKMEMDRYQRIFKIIHVTCYLYGKKKHLWLTPKAQMELL
jgi:hypothetical protein